MKWPQFLGYKKKHVAIEAVHFDMHTYGNQNGITVCEYTSLEQGS